MIYGQCRQAVTVLASWSGAVLGAAMLSLLAGQAIGQEAREATETVSVELNRLEQTNGACQAYLVVGNTTPADFETLGVDLVMFDQDGIITRRVAVDLAPLPAGKTSVRVFSLDGMECDSVGRVLLNSVVSCEDGTGERTDCLGLVKPSSRAAAAFIE